MHGNDLRPQLQRHGPRAEDALRDDQRDQRDGERHRHASPPGDSPYGKREQSEGRRKVSMHHLGPCLVRFHRRIRKQRLRHGNLFRRRRHRQKSVTPRPVGATQARIHQARVGAQHDNHRRQREASENEPFHCDLTAAPATSPTAEPQRLRYARGRRTDAAPKQKRLRRLLDQHPHAVRHARRAVSAAPGTKRGGA